MPGKGRQHNFDWSTRSLPRFRRDNASPQLHLSPPERDGYASASAIEPNNPVKWNTIAPAPAAMTSNVRSARPAARGLINLLRRPGLPRTSSTRTVRAATYSIGDRGE